MACVPMRIYHVISAFNKAFIHQQCRQSLPFLFKRRKDIDLQVRCMTLKESNQLVSALDDKYILLQKIKSAEDSSTVLEIVGYHYSTMDTVHVLQSLKSLFELQKSGCSGTTVNNLNRSPEFVKLCQSLTSNSRSIQINDTIGALKIVSYLGVPSTSATFQSLLQLIRHQVNELSLSQIVFVDFILSKNCESCQLIGALNIALPIVFEAQLKTKLNRSDVVHLSEMLQYAAKKSLSENSINLLLECLEKCCEEMDATTAKNIIWSLMKLNRRVMSPSLLHQALQILALDLDRLTFKEVYSLLNNVIMKHTEKYEHFYHADFMNGCAMYVVKHDCGLENGTRILRKLARIGHVNISLLDYLGDKVVKDPEAFIDCDPSVVLTLISGLSNANYKPKNWSLIEKAVLKNKRLIQGKVELPWIKFVLDLASLGCFSTSLLQKVFQDNFLRRFLSRENNFLDHIQLLLLYQAVATLYLDYDGPFPSKDIIEKAASTNGNHIKHFPLQGALEQGLGGAPYVLTKAYTKLGHFIDHVVVMRKGGYPVAINHNEPPTRMFVEDLNTPADSKVILILVFHPGCYAVNIHRLRGYFSLLQRSLESSGFPVVPVSLLEWDNTPDNEKIPYIMQNIKLKNESQ